MVVTEEWLRSNMNGGIGVSAKQIKALGLSYPPKKGWLRGMIGKEITDRQAEDFVNGRSAKTKVSEGADGVMRDSVDVFRHIKGLPFDEFMRSPLVAYGFMKSPATSCAVCAGKLRSVFKDKCKQGVHYVSVCNECAGVLDGKAFEDMTIETVGMPMEKRLQGRYVADGTSFDDMRKVGG